MTRAEDLSRARKYTEGAVHPSDYSTLDEYLNAVASELNIGYVETDRENLTKIYEGGGGFVSEQEVVYVKQQLPKLRKQDRVRRDRIDAAKFRFREKLLAKGIRGEALKERMKKFQPPQTLREAPKIPEPRKPTSPLEAVRRRGVSRLLHPTKPMYAMNPSTGHRNRVYAIIRTEKRTSLFNKNGELIIVSRRVTEPRKSAFVIKPSTGNRIRYYKRVSTLKSVSYYRKNGELITRKQRRT